MPHLTSLSLFALLTATTCFLLGRRVSRISPLETFVITIADTGKGIAKEDLPRIFEPFFSKKDAGTGLGLAITQGIIQEHNGKLKVTSAIGEGTEFTIQLPISVDG